MNSGGVLNCDIVPISHPAGLRLLKDALGEIAFSLSKISGHWVRRRRAANVNEDGIKNGSAAEVVQALRGEEVDVVSGGGELVPAEPRGHDAGRDQDRAADGCG